MTDHPDIRSGVEGTAPALVQKGERRPTVPSVDILDTFPRPRQSVSAKYTSDEVTALCPITDQPDWYEVKIEILDTSELYIESKSLKLYLGSWRNVGAFAETLAHRIALDVSQAIDCADVLVKVTQKPRGGIAIETVAGGSLTPMPEEDT